MDGWRGDGADSLLYPFGATIKISDNILLAVMVV